VNHHFFRSKLLFKLAHGSTHSNDNVNVLGRALTNKRTLALNQHCDSWIMGKLSS